MTDQQKRKFWTLNLASNTAKNNEILFSIRFSTTFSTIFSTIFENIKISILVPFWATIDHKINFTQNTSHFSFISKKNLCSSSQILLETSTFYPIFIIFNSEWGRFVIFQINADFLINQLTKDTLRLSFISNKNLRPPSQNLLETSTFYHTFTSFHSGWGQINTNLLII